MWCHQYNYESKCWLKWDQSNFIRKYYKRLQTHIFCHVNCQNLIGHRHNPGTRHGVKDVQLQDRKKNYRQKKWCHKTLTSNRKKNHFPRKWCHKTLTAVDGTMWFLSSSTSLLWPWRTKDHYISHRFSECSLSVLWGFFEGSYFRAAEVLQVSFSHSVKGWTAGSEDGDWTGPVEDWSELSFLQTKL